MPIYNAPIRDMQFIIHEMLNAKQLGGYDKFSDVDTDLIDAILEESGKFATDVLTPLNAVGDHEGCTRHADGSVTTPTGFKDAFKPLAKCNLQPIWHSLCIRA